MSKPQEEVNCILDNTSSRVGVTDKTILDRELTPILAELGTLGPGNDQHVAVGELFSWLSDPERTGEEFTYVMGELADDVCFVMEEHFTDYVYEEGCCRYQYRIAAQALALKCPVLKGSWEQAAWTLVMRIDSKHCGGGFSCDLLSAWTLNVINNPDVCPNPYLRYELIVLLTNIVKLNDCDSAQAIQTILFACSSNKIDYHLSSPIIYHQTHGVLSKCSSIDMEYLTNTLEHFTGLEDIKIINLINEIAKDGYILEYDDKLSKRLLEVKSSRCSAMINDVGYLCEVNPNRFTEPRELYGLIALFKSNAGWVHRITRQNEKKTYNLPGLGDASKILYTLIKHFKVSCQMPQLMFLTASCVLDILKAVNQIIVDQNQINLIDGNIYLYILSMIKKLLSELPDSILALMSGHHHYNVFVNTLNQFFTD